VSELLQTGLAQVRTLLLDYDTLIRAVASGRRRATQPRWRRVELRYVDLRSGRHLQITGYDDTQAFTHNVPLGESASRAVDDLLAEPFSTWQVERPDSITSLRVTKKGHGQLQTAGRQPSSDRGSEHREHDRVKPRLLPADDAYLRAVGISDSSGRVKPSMQAKYRQVEEFLRLLAVAVDEALATDRIREPTTAEPLHIVDLGCGNAYLTFAAFRYLSVTRGLAVRMTGVDAKAQAHDRNAALAELLGCGDALRFRQASITDVVMDAGVDVALALHACDTATDDALARAVEWRTPLVLGAPCCHHYLQAQLRRVSPPEPFGLVTRHGILRERLADTLTDGMRAALLRLHGYRVDVVEFVASRHTPRNTMLRALRTGAPVDATVRRQYDELVAMWQVRPKLAELLADA